MNAIIFFLWKNHLIINFIYFFYLPMAYIIWHLFTNNTVLFDWNDHKTGICYFYMKNISCKQKEIIIKNNHNFCSILIKNKIHEFFIQFWKQWIKNICHRQNFKNLLNFRIQIIILFLTLNRFRINIF